MTLEILTSDRLGSVRHGFFTRRGGASSGIYAGLNCGIGSMDQQSVVALNRARVAVAMNVSSDRLLSLHQIHSADVTVATAAGWSERPKCDGVVTAEPGIAISVLTADCAPVLLADQEAGVIGAAHAGWRGALEGVVEATVAAMVGLGADRDAIEATVGPTISQSNYEVGEEFFERFADSDQRFSRFFANGREGKYLFDLPMFVVGRLREAGVSEASWIGCCTYAEPERFYSYRRSTHRGEPDYGRLISSIVLERGSSDSAD